MSDVAFHVGDRVLVEQAWEDETGAFHDEHAEILAIREDERVELEFDLDEYDPEQRESIATDLRLSQWTLENLTMIPQEVDLPPEAIGSAKP